VSEDAGIEPMTVATLALTAMRNNHKARSHYRRLDLIHRRLDLIHILLDLVHGYTYSMGFSRGKGRGWEGGGGRW
jgi:hypothetical protein